LALTDSVFRYNVHEIRNFISERRKVKVKFVDSALRHLKPDRVKYDVRDPEDTGLTLRVSPDGRKTWMVRLSSPTGVIQVRAIGKYPMMSIAEAREAARSAVGGDQDGGRDA
jgi:hypothetical protein